MAKLIDKVVCKSYQASEADFIKLPNSEGEYLHENIWNFDKVIYEFDNSKGSFRLTGTSKVIDKAIEKLEEEIESTMVQLLPNFSLKKKSNCPNTSSTRTC
jgi:hypothetical protein